MVTLLKTNVHCFHSCLLLRWLHRMPQWPQGKYWLQVNNSRLVTHFDPFSQRAGLVIYCQPQDERPLNAPLTGYYQQEHFKKYTVVSISWISCFGLLNKLGRCLLSQKVLSRYRTGVKKKAGPSENLNCVRKQEETCKSSLNRGCNAAICMNFLPFHIRVQIICERTPKPLEIRKGVCFIGRVTPILI